ncbi:hypothetical protein A4R43_00865 [Amycolatopsis albispora]|uniref:STAS domain-containing protein n=1 Tax=Amycolatopsis albispora TaxID=1804986 RepID=A0A344KZL9_9PSEU|nr:hypothetical protein A4R43_00865 [Amycolatopsis albispora]
MLPTGLPVLPGLRLAAGCLLAEADETAGGDWFDAVPLPGGRVALVVGDVVGRGVPASATMAQLRAVVQDRLDETGEVLPALAAADRLATRLPAAHAATVCIVVLTPGDGALVCGSAGHPPPLVTGGGRARYLPVPASGPLGTHATYTTTADRLGGDEVVLLYSDGIIERPGRDPGEATAEFARVTTEAVADAEPGTSAVERACTRTLDRLVRATGTADDIALLGAQRVAPAGPLRLHLPADVSVVRVARGELTRWLEELAVGEDDQFALLHAVNELVTNAVEHSHPDSLGGTVSVTGTLDDTGVVHIEVADDGSWHERSWPASVEVRREQGLGLAMTSQFVDRLDFDRGAGGTTATIHHRLVRPARLVSAGDVAGGRATAGGPAEMTLIVEQPHAPSSRIAVHGPLDVTSSDQFARELEALTMGYSHPLTVDLTAVTHFASAAIAVLHRATTRDHRNGTALRLYAPVGSPAHHVLSLVDLPHTTVDPHRPA